VALLGLASMLYQCNMLDEGIHVTILAMDLSPDVVAIHFMLANLYAAKVCFASIFRRYFFQFGMHLLTYVRAVEHCC